MLVPFLNSPSTVLLGVLAAFVFTCLAVQLGSRRLPRDMGREYAVQGQLSAGKPRGAGFLFILAFTAAALLFAPISLEMVLYLLMTFASMMTGFLDDCSSTPWDEYRKGLLDLAVSVLTIVTYINFNGTEVRFALLGKSWQVNQTTAVNMNIEVIALVVLGGTSTAGGVGGVTGTLFAALIVGVLKRRLALMGLGGDIYNFVLGGVLIASLIMFAYLEKKKKIVSREMAIKNMDE